MTNMKDFADRFATDRAIDWFDKEIQVLESTLNSVRQAKASYEAKRAQELTGTYEGRFGMPEDEVSNVLNALKSMPFNSRVDLAPSVVVAHVVGRLDRNKEL